MRARGVRGALFCALVVLAAALGLASSGVGVSKAQESITLMGGVVNGTQGAGPVAAGLPVLLLLSAEDGSLSATGQTTTDAAGRFRFEQVERLEGGTYTLGVEYAGVLYRISLTSQEVEKELHLTVFETTADVSAVAVTRQVMVVADVDKGSREVAATEIVRLVNRGDRTLLPDPLAGGPMSLLRFSLPIQSSGLIVQSDLPPGEVISVGTGFALTSPVAPGAHVIEFSYLFPYSGDQVSYRQNLPQGAEIYQVLVPERLPEVQVTGLELIAPVDIQGSVFRAWEGRNFSPGQGPALELNNLPQPGMLVRLRNSLTDGTFWRGAIPLAAAAALALLLLIGVMKVSRRPAGQVSIASRNSISEESVALVQEIAELDERYQRGEVDEDRYQAVRQILKSRVLEPSRTYPAGSDEPAASSDPDGR